MKMFYNLRKLREDMGVSLEEMATLLNLKSRSGYWKKENGSIDFTIREAKIIADYFNRSIEEVFFGKSVSKMETRPAGVSAKKKAVPKKSKKREG